MLPDYVLGLDLAQASDWSALVVLECDLAGSQPEYRATHLERWRAESYTAVPKRVRRVEAALRRRWQELAWAANGNWPAFAADAPITLALDATGVGAAVVDLMRDAGLDPTPIVIHGGDAVGRAEAGGWRVPKRDLVSVLQVLLQRRRLRIAEAMPEAAVLVRELASFRVTIAANGHDRYGAAGAGALEWREKPHDDMVLAVALAAWLAERELANPPVLSAEVLRAFGYLD